MYKINMMKLQGTCVLSVYNNTHRTIDYRATDQKNSTYTTGHNMYRHGKQLYCFLCAVFMLVESGQLGGLGYP